MKLKKKEFAILIPMIVLAVLITVSVFYPQEQEQVFTQADCQEGWIKYELRAGVLCSKTELTPEELAEFGQ